MQPTLPEPGLAHFMNRVLDDVTSAGARAAELLFHGWAGHHLKRRHGRLEAVERPEGTRLSGRVYLDGGRSASFSVSVADHDKALAAARKALERAGKAPEDPLAAPPDRYGLSTRGLGIKDARFDLLTLSDREDVARMNEECFDNIDGAICLGVSYTDSNEIRAFATTRGGFVESPSTRYEVRVGGRSEDGRYELQHRAAGRNFSYVGSLPFGVALGRRLNALTGETSEHPGEVPLVLEPAVLGWFIARIAPAFDERAVAAGRSFVTGIGQPIASYRVHLVDDGRLAGALHTRAFDDRGSPSMPIPIIKEGLVGSLYNDARSARAQNVRPTGHDHDGELKPTNLVLRPGNRSRTQMLSEVPVSLRFDHLKGKVDPVAGTVAVEGPAYRMEGSTTTGVVHGVKLRCRIADLLSAVQELANNQDRAQHVDCATGLLVGLPVA